MPTGKGAAKAFRIGTAAAKKSGCKSFKKGSACDRKRKHIAEKVAMKKRK